MVTTQRAPGVWEATAPPARRGLAAVRMDVCGFAGVAPRGPARARGAIWPDGAPDAPAVRRSLAYAVESWAEYRRLYGGFEGPGLLPYAVASFFDQGGRRAWVTRIVHDYGGAEDDEGVAWGVLEGVRPRLPRGLPLRAPAVGRAGDGITVALTWRVAPLPLIEHGREVLVVAGDADVRDGSLLRVRFAAGHAGFATVDRATSRVRGGAAQIVVSLEAPLSGVPESADVVTCDVVVTAPDGSTETYAGLGLSPAHEPWLGRALAGSSVVRPHPRWMGAALAPVDPELTAPTSTAVLGAGAPDRAAAGRLEGVAPVRDGLWLAARDEGRWGDGVRAALRFRTRPIRPRGVDAGALILDRDAPVAAGTLLRFVRPDGAKLLREAIGTAEEWSMPGGGVRVVRVALDAAVPPGPIGTVEVVEGEMEIEDAGAPEGGRRERLVGLGLSPLHPRWLGRALLEESALVYPDAEWIDARLDLTPDLAASPARAHQFRGGADRYADIVAEDFFDPRWSPVEEIPGDGVHALLRAPDLALLVVPDLYAPAPLPPSDAIVDDPLAGPEFRPCVHLPVTRVEPAIHALDGLRLDPRVPAERERILELQRRLVELADAHGGFTVLLDVPPKLSQRQILEWRTRFDSPFAAAYHPWVYVAHPDDGQGRRVRVNPAAVAAGIVAARERMHGVPHGPANAVARGAVGVADRVAPGEHDALHPEGINVFLQERGGVRLTGARTLSRRAAYRQLSVRRIVTQIARTLERRMRWTVFEPHTSSLRAEVVRLVTGLLRRLHREGAFAGRDEADAFFVRCDEGLNPRAEVDAGRLRVEIGIAPAEPVEFIVFRLAREGDGTLRVEG